MDIRVIAVQDLATGEAGITGIKRRDLRIRAAGTEQRLRKALSQQRLANALRSGEKIGMPHLLRRQRATQDIYCMFMTDNIPASSLILTRFHTDYSSRIGQEWQ